MKLILLLLLLTTCDFPNRGDDVSYVSYDYAYEVAKHECKSKANQSLYDCLKEMDFDNDDLIIPEEVKQ